MFQFLFAVLLNPFVAGADALRSPCDLTLREPSSAQIEQAADTYLRAMQLERHHRAIVLEQFQAIYREHNPLKNMKLQGWLPLESVLQNAPRDVENWDALPVHGRLNFFISVGKIEGHDSQGLTKRLANKSEKQVKAYPFWPAGDMDFKNNTGTMTADKLRLNVVTEDGKAEIIEGMIFTNGAWVPFLYEYQENQKKFVRVFSSQNGVHSIAKCMVCHGAGEDFSPIPFKSSPSYTPSKGWFFSDHPESFISRRLSADWSVSDHDSLINSIRAARTQ